MRGRGAPLAPRLGQRHPCVGVKLHSRPIVLLLVIIDTPSMPGRAARLGPDVISDLALLALCLGRDR